MYFVKASTIIYFRQLLSIIACTSGFSVFICIFFEFLIINLFWSSFIAYALCFNVLSHFRCLVVLSSNLRNVCSSRWPWLRKLSMVPASNFAKSLIILAENNSGKIHLLLVHWGNIVYIKFKYSTTNKNWFVLFSWISNVCFTAYR